MGSKVYKNKIWQCLLGMLVLVGILLGGYAVHGTMRINALKEMSFHDMLAFTTKDNASATIAVGIIQNGHMHLQVYGENASLIEKTDTLYEIGSITKTFTAALIDRAVRDGRVNLDTSLDQVLDLPVREYYPSIHSLITHTSGYKSHYMERPMLANQLLRKNDFYGISREILLNRLAKVRLAEKEYPFAYSNFGIAVLGAVLEEIYHRPYQELMSDFLVSELALTSTFLPDGENDQDNFWEWQKADAYIPAGAIISTAPDMLRYLQIHMGKELEYVNIDEQMLIVRGSSTAQRQMGIHIDATGGGWMFDAVNRFFWHNGATSHYNSYIGFCPDTKTGVVVLANLSPRYRIPATIMGIALLQSLQK